MSDNVKNLQAAIDASKELKKKYSELMRQAESVSSQILDSVASVVLTPTEDEGEIEELSEMISDLADEFGLTWTGGYDAYNDWQGEWNPGEKIEFWEPSTC